MWAECRRAGEIFFPGNIVCRRAELLPTTALLVIQRARKESGLVFAKKQSGVVFAKKQSGVAVPTPARWCGARSGVGRGWMWCGRCDPSALVWREEWGRAAGGCGVAVVNQGHHVWLLETWSCYRTAPAQWGASRVEAFACRRAELLPTTALLVAQRARPVWQHLLPGPRSSCQIPRSWLPSVRVPCGSICFLVRRVFSLVRRAPPLQPPPSKAPKIH